MRAVTRRTPGTSRVVAHDVHVVVNALEDTRAVVFEAAEHAVGRFDPLDAAAVRCDEALVAEAYAEDRALPPSEEGQASSEVGFRQRVPGAGGDDDGRVRGLVVDIEVVDGDDVGSHLRQTVDELDEIEGVGIVVVDDQDGRTAVVAGHEDGVGELARSRASRRTITDFEVGVLLTSATDSRGTSTFVSG